MLPLPDKPPCTPLTAYGSIGRNIYHDKIDASAYPRGSHRRGVAAYCCFGAGGVITEPDEFLNS